MTDAERVALQRALTAELAEAGEDWSAAENAARAIVVAYGAHGDLRRAVASYVDGRIAIHRAAVIERITRRAELAVTGRIDPRQVEMDLDGLPSEGAP